jgi:hypothetical protein
MIPHHLPGADIQWTVSEQSEAEVEARSLWSVGMQSGQRVGGKLFLEYER